MDVKYANPFVESFHSVMSQIGFGDTQLCGITTRTEEVNTSGVLVVLGIVGHMKGNVVYTMDIEAAKKIASTMMMGMPVEELCDMSKSALAELTNMLTATAATLFSNDGIAIEISTPTLLLGENVNVKTNADSILCARLTADSNPMEINISFEN